MMVLFFTRLLLIALLLQHTEENKELMRQKPPKLDETVHYQEFCLRLPEDPRSTGLVSGTHLPTKPASTSNPTRQKPKSPKLPVQQPKQSDPDLDPVPEIANYSFDDDDHVDVVVPMMAPNGVHSAGGHFRVPEGCYCKKENMKPSNETSRVGSLTIRYPSEICRSTEYIETLQDGRKVCTTHFSLLAHLVRFLSKAAPEPGSTKSPEVSSTALQNPTEAQSTTTELAVTTNESPLMFHPTKLHELPTILCKSCDPFMKNPDDFDLKAVQFLDVIGTPSHCASLIYTHQKDGRVFCSGLSHFRILLQNLEVPSPQEENVVAGCHCYEKAKRPLPEILPVTRATIWLPKENCSSTEFIETLSDDREVCVTPPSLITYLEKLEENRVPGILRESNQLSFSRIVIPVDEGMNRIAVQLSPREAAHCVGCFYSVKWNSFDPKDVQSVELNLPSSDCPAVLFVRLSDGEHICMDSSHQEFNQLLEKMQSREL